MHDAAKRWVVQILRQLPPRRWVYEIGSRVVNDGVRPLFGDAERYYGVDLFPGPGVDAVADARVHVPPFAPDTVVCCEVLEHTPYAAQILAQAARTLLPGGVLIVTCAAPERPPHSGLDGGPVREGEHYRGVAPDELDGWLTAAGLVGGFVHHDPTAGDCYAVAWKPLSGAGPGDRDDGAGSGSESTEPEDV